MISVPFRESYKLRSPSFCVCLRVTITVEEMVVSCSRSYIFYYVVFTVFTTFTFTASSIFHAYVRVVISRPVLKRNREIHEIITRGKLVKILRSAGLVFAVKLLSCLR